jgi:hypothetical protein
VNPLSLAGEGEGEGERLGQMLASTVALLSFATTFDPPRRH